MKESLFFNELDELGTLGVRKSRCVLLMYGVSEEVPVSLGRDGNNDSIFLSVNLSDEFRLYVVSKLGSITEVAVYWSEDMKFAFGWKYGSFSMNKNMTVYTVPFFLETVTVVTVLGFQKVFPPSFPVPSGHDLALAASYLP